MTAVAELGLRRRLRSGKVRAENRNTGEHESSEPEVFDAFQQQSLAKEYQYNRAPCGAHIRVVSMAKIDSTSTVTATVSNVTGTVSDAELALTLLLILLYFIQFFLSITNTRKGNYFTIEFNKIVTYWAFLITAIVMPVILSYAADIMLNGPNSFVSPYQSFMKIYVDILITFIIIDITLIFAVGHHISDGEIFAIWFLLLPLSMFFDFMALVFVIYFKKPNTHILFHDKFDYALLALFCASIIASGFAVTSASSCLTHHNKDT